MKAARSATLAAFSPRLERLSGMVRFIDRMTKAGCLSATPAFVSEHEDAPPCPLSV